MGPLDGGDEEIKTPLGIKKENGTSLGFNPKHQKRRRERGEKETEREEEEEDKEEEEENLALYRARGRASLEEGH